MTDIILGQISVVVVAVVGGGGGNGSIVPAKLVRVHRELMLPKEALKLKVDIRTAWTPVGRPVGGGVRSAVSLQSGPSGERLRTGGAAEGPRLAAAGVGAPVFLQSRRQGEGLQALFTLEQAPGVGARALVAAHTTGSFVLLLA